MFLLAIRQLQNEPIRTLLTGLAISTVIAVILILRGFEKGLYLQLESVVLDRGGDLIVSQSGIKNFLAVRSSLRQLSRREIESIPGVINAHPITTLLAIYEQNDNKTPIAIIVYDTLGGPMNIVSGSFIEEENEIIIDQSLAKEYNLKPDDEFVVYDFLFRVSGITKNSAAFFTPLVFINYDGLIDFFIESEIAPDITTFPLLSFLLVELKPPASPENVNNLIENNIGDVDVFTPQQLANNDVQLGKDLFGPVMVLLVSIAYVIGLLVVGLIIYSDVRGRLRTFGVLKALGFSMNYISAAVIIQNLMLLIIAFPIGILLSMLISNIIEINMPLYLLPVLDTGGLSITLLASVLFTIFGSVLPLRLIAKTDPTIAFQGN
ncbi:MAG: FtsX-like permease family protein [Candidatus Dadabacteria bacterium]|nr:FtsX-like permease family protein [Candidatus Dadabacteria bacterium]